MKKNLLWKIGAILFLVLICVWMFIIGRGHTVYFDNVSLEYEGETYGCPYRVDVFVNGEKVAKLREKDRGMATWIGQNFKMDLEITQEKGGEPVTQTIALKLPYSLDGIVLNLPGLLAGLPEEAYTSEFVSLATVIDSGAEEEVITDEFALGDI